MHDCIVFRARACPECLGGLQAPFWRGVAHLIANLEGDSQVRGGPGRFAVNDH